MIASRGTRWSSLRIQRPLRSPPVERARTFELYFFGQMHVDDVPGTRYDDSGETVEALLAHSA